MKRKLMIPGLAVFIMLGISIASLSMVYAQEVSTSYPPVVEKLAEKFNLNPSDVQEVFEEVRNEHMAERHAQFVDKLDDLVVEGKITDEQRQVILDKHEEMQSLMEDFQGSDPETHKEKMQALHEEFRAWAESQNLDLSQIGLLGKGMGRVKGPGPHMMWSN